MILGGYLERYFNSCKIVIMSGAFLVASACFSASFVKTLSSFVLLYGCMFGIGVGMSYTSSIVLCARWNPDHKSLVTGCIVSGIGIGAFIFGLLSVHLVNPHNIPVGVDGYYPAYCSVTERVPTMLRTLGAIYACLMTVGCSLIVDLPPEESSQPSKFHILDQGDNWIGQGRESRSVSFSSSGKGRESRSHSNASVLYGTLDASIDVVNDHEKDCLSSQNSASLTLRDSEIPFSSQEFDHDCGHSQQHVLVGILGELTPLEVVVSSHAWQLSMSYVMTTVGGVYLAGNVAELGGNYFAATSFLTGVASSSSLFNGFGRPLWGALGDRFGSMKVVQIMSFIYALIIYTYNWASSLQSEFLFCLWTFSIFFCLGGNFCLYFPISITISGSTHASANYGLIFMGLSVCEFLNIMILAKYEVSFADASAFMGTLCMLGCFNINWLAYRLQNHQSNRTEKKESDCVNFELQHKNDVIQVAPR